MNVGGMTYDEESLAFYFEIGVTLTQWAFVEEALMDIAGSCVNKRDADTVAHAFLALDSFRHKLAMVDALVSNAFAKKPLRIKEWKALQVKTNETARERNKLAHHLSREFPHAPPGRRAVLLPWVDKKKDTHKILSRSSSPAAGIGMRDIGHIRLRIVMMHCELWNFHAKLEHRKVPHPASALPEVRHPTIDDLLGPIRAVQRAPSKRPLVKS